MRTRIVARAALFSSFSDDLRRVIGSETSRSGMTMLFDMLQHPVLNKRLGIVILEGILQTLFHEQDFRTIFQKLHSRSSRVKDELKNSQRKYSDLLKRNWRRLFGFWEDSSQQTLYWLYLNQLPFVYFLIASERYMNGNDFLSIRDLCDIFLFENLSNYLTLRKHNILLFIRFNFDDDR